MEREFFEMFDKHKDILRLRVSYSRNTDWAVSVHERVKSEDGQEPCLILHQNCDRRTVFAKAYLSLVDWYYTKFGGY